MPWQLIYTSAPRGLLSGQSGFCTVGRSEELRETLVQRLEQISSYHYLRVSAVGKDGGNPTISAFRILDIRGAKHQVLTRIHPCGLDFTARTNHVAHHLIFQAAELPRTPSPAVILRGWSGWVTSWQGEPRLLRDVSVEELQAITRPVFPAQAWQRMTGDAGRAAGLLESEYVHGCYLVCPQGEESQLLDMYAETLQLLDLTGQFPLRPWRHSFTTFMQAEDNPLDFQWRGCQEGTPAYQAAAQNSAPMVDLQSVRVPGNSLVKIARDSQKAPVPSPAPARKETRAAPTLSRREPEPPKRAPAPVFEASHFPRQQAPAGRSRFLRMNLWVDSSALLRLGIFAAVLLAVIGVRMWMNRRAAVSMEPPMAVANPRPEAPVVSEPAAPVLSPAVNLTELDALWTDGPTYLVLASNLNTFVLPIQSSARFQNLLHRYDALNLLPAQIQVMFTTNVWDLSSEKRLTVLGRKGPQLVAGSGADGEAQCVFDYSGWLSQNDEPVRTQTKLQGAPGAISVRFLFASTNDGDAFRLMIIDPDKSLAPLVVSRHFLRGGALDTRLSQRLSEIHLTGGESWRLRPFVRTRDGQSTRYLYAGWPQEERPAPDNELDFGSVTHHLTEVEKPLREKAETLQHDYKQWPKGGFELSLGEALHSTNKHLANFENFARGDYSAGTFLDYLNRLKKDRAHLADLGDWPEFHEDADTGVLAEQFQELYALLTHKFPASVHDLTIDNTNYFYATWRDLIRMDGAKRQAQRANDEWQAARQRLESVPSELDETAYVGLFIVGPGESRPRVEMIRFQ